MGLEDNAFFYCLFNSFIETLFGTVLLTSAKLHCHSPSNIHNYKYASNVHNIFRQGVSNERPDSKKYISWVLFK